LRGKIIDLARVIKPQPAAPDEVDELVGLARPKPLVRRSAQPEGEMLQGHHRVRTAIDGRCSDAVVL